MIWSVASLLVCACILAAQNVQTPSSPTTKPEDRCSIEGTITSAKTGQALGRAEVEVRKAEGNSQGTYDANSDSTGHYIVDNLDPGTYILAASRNGYVNASYGSETKKRNPTILTLTSGQHLTKIDVKLLSQAVVTGRVIDEGNEAMANVNVSLDSRIYQNGKRALVPSGMASTNDKGEYRIFGVAPGKYWVLANVGNNGGIIKVSADVDSPKKDQTAYPSTYYPSALSPSEASPIQLAAGAEMDGVDFHLFKIKSFAVSGTVSNQSSARHVTVQLLPHEGEAALAWDRTKMTLTNPDGKFVLHGIAPGRYQLVANSFSAENRSSSHAEVVVSTNDVAVSLELGQNPDLPGSVRSDDPSDILKPGITLLLQPEGGMMGALPASTKEDGTFILKSVSLDRFRLLLFPLPEGHYIKSVQLGGVELQDTLLDLNNGVPAELSITLSAKGATISGAIQDDQQKPVTNATVVLVPNDHTLQSRYQTASADQQGQYTLKGIHPGSYKVFAFDNAEYDTWLDAEWLKPYETEGESIEVKELEKASKKLVLIITNEQ